jgi:hypothetical protein
VYTNTWTLQSSRNTRIGSTRVARSAGAAQTSIEQTMNPATAA